MNREKLRLAEKMFLTRYPDGFAAPEMLEIGRKHKIEKMIRMTAQGLAPDCFGDTDSVLDTVRRVVSSSSLVSVFEKPKFRDLLKDILPDERKAFAEGMMDLLHGDQQAGFKQLISILLPYKLAKWTLLTVCLIYSRPDYEVFIKPTTAKNAIAYFELDGLKYSPLPTFEFYDGYRTQINEMKSLCDKRLQVDNAAFSGFLMMSMEAWSVL